MAAYGFISWRSQKSFFMQICTYLRQTHRPDTNEHKNMQAHLLTQIMKWQRLWSKLQNHWMWQVCVGVRVCVFPLLWQLQWRQRSLCPGHRRQDRPQFSADPPVCPGWGSSSQKSHQFPSAFSDMSPEVVIKPLWLKHRSARCLHRNQQRESHQCNSIDFNTPAPDLHQWNKVHVLGIWH